MKIVGHQKQWRLMQKTVELDRIAHAYLFYGPEGVGKKTVAIEFVKLLNCKSTPASSRPCGKCRPCLDIQKGIFPDFLFIEPEKTLSPTSHSTTKGEIKIAQIRKLQQHLSLKPYNARFKVAVMDQAHCLSSQASGALLKTLEEPKGDTILILITEYPDMLLPTILSRVQKIRFSGVGLSEITQALRDRQVSEQKAKKIAAFSIGKPGLALNLLSNPQSLSHQSQWINELEKIVNSPLGYRFQYSKKVCSGDFEQLEQILNTWLKTLRSVLLDRFYAEDAFSKQSISAYRNFNKFRYEGKGGGGNFVSPVSENSEQAKLASARNRGLLENIEREPHRRMPMFYSISKLNNVLSVLQQTIYLISFTNVKPRLALDRLMIEL